MNIYIGIDPGVSGAIAILAPDGVTFHDMPILGNYSEGGQKIKKPCPAYFSNDYIENLILNWREN